MVSNNFTKILQDFQEELRENTLELSKNMERAREIEVEIPMLREKLHKNEVELNRLRPLIRELEHEKMEFHRKLQQTEELNRKEINEHIRDKTKPLNLHEHRN